MRKTQKLMENWRFTGLDGKQQTLHLPHTWNALDGQDGGNNYARGTCLYETAFPCPAFDPETECVYLEFRGVNASAAVTLHRMARAAAVAAFGSVTGFGIYLRSLYCDNALLVAVKARADARAGAAQAAPRRHRRRNREKIYPPL